MLYQLRQDLLNDLLIQSKLFLNSFLELDLEVVVLEVKLGQRDVFGQALDNRFAILIRKFNATVTHRNSPDFQTLADRVEQSSQATCREPCVIQDKRLHSTLLREEQTEIANHVVADTLVITQKQFREFHLPAHDLPDKHLHVETRQASTT